MSTETTATTATATSGPTLTDEQVTAEAVLLDEAERARQPIRQTTQIYPDAGLDDAYRIQAAWRSLRLDRGETLVGHKIGLTSRAMQQAMNITTPDSGFITDAMVFDPGSVIDATAHLDAKLEVELAFVLSTNLDADVADDPDFGVEAVLDATDHVVPALELIAARSFRRDPDTGRSRTVIDTISDNAANAGIITGGNRIDPRSTDLRWVGAILRRNGVVEETGLAAGVLDHPANGIVWLAKRYAGQGMSLLAGQTILAGSFTRPVDVAPGDVFEADYGPLGSFEIRFGPDQLRPEPEPTGGAS